MDSTLLSAIVGAFATIGAAAIGFLGLRKPAKTLTKIEVLPNRIAVLEKASSLVKSASQSVIDTTWGNSEENFLPAEQAALNSYLFEKSRVTKKPDIDYREIYTETPDDSHRNDRIKKEQDYLDRPEKYSAKLLHGLSPSFPMIDFLVVDGKKAILSCLSKDIAKPDHHHLYIESEELSSFLTQYFQICWDEATSLRPNRPNERPKPEIRAEKTS